VFVSVVVICAPQRQNAGGGGVEFGGLTAINSGALHRVIFGPERILDSNRAGSLSA